MTNGREKAFSHEMDWLGVWLPGLLNENGEQPSSRTLCLPICLLAFCMLSHLARVFV